jgi:hypothetical protein
MRKQNVVVSVSMSSRWKLRINSAAAAAAVAAGFVEVARKLASRTMLFN